MGKIIKGDELMVFKDGKSISLATSHTVNVSADTADVTTKDHGKYGSKEVNKINWEISSENLVEDGGNYDDMMDIMLAGTAIDVVFARKAETDESKTVADGDYDNWTPAQSKRWYSGKVILTTLNLNAPSGDNASFSATFSGVGAIVPHDGPAA